MFGNGNCKSQTIIPQVLTGKGGGEMGEVGGGHRQGGACWW